MSQPGAGKDSAAHELATPVASSASEERASMAFTGQAQGDLMAQAMNALRGGPTRMQDTVSEARAAQLRAISNATGQAKADLMAEAMNSGTSVLAAAGFMVCEHHLGRGHEFFPTNAFEGSLSISEASIYYAPQIEIQDFLEACRDDTGDTAIGLLDAKGHVPKAWVESTSVFEGSDTDWTALQRACIRDYVDLARRLIDGGADVALAKRDGATCLYLASEYGKIAAATLLLDNGADASAARIDDGSVPLHMAAQNGHLAVVKLLVERGGTDPNVAKDDNATPLLNACCHGGKDAYLAVVVYLLDKGADVNASNAPGGTPLYMACLFGHTKIATELILRGAKIGKLVDEDANVPGEAELLPLSLARVFFEAEAVARTRCEEEHQKALASKDERHLEAMDAALDAKDAMAARLWELLPPIEGAEKPDAAAFLEDPEAVIAPFEGHPSRQRERFEAHVAQGMDGSDGD